MRPPRLLLICDRKNKADYPMRFAYLILAHGQFDQLKALLRCLTLAAPQDHVYLHIDLKTALPEALRHSLETIAPSRVHVISQRYNVLWGHESQCLATFALIRAARAQPFDYAHLLSGVDWPIATRADIVAQIAANTAACYIDAQKFTQQKRMQDYWFHNSYLNPRAHLSLKQRYASWGLKQASRLVNTLNKRLNIKRATPFGALWVHGSTWWSLPASALTQGLPHFDALVQQGRLRYTACSDEHVIPSYVYANHGTAIQPNMRYTDWSEGLSSPKTLTLADLSALHASQCWFARKFDASVDDFFLDRFAF
jgi:hypothetical protein